MFTDFNLGNALEKLIEKLSGWGEEIILKVPNFILAILVLSFFGI